MNEIRWGLIGCGHIAAKFAENIKSVQHAKLIACSSKDAQKAQEFAKSHQIELSYGDYAEMLGNPSIDAVYIATTHNYHYENALLCIQYGKHILCEKAFTINADQAKEIFREAKEKNLFVMEAMWTRFLPATRWMKEQIRNGVIGEPASIVNHFGFAFPYDPASRLFDIQLAGGGLLDLGIYPISNACNIFGNNPVEIHSVAKIGQTGVDEQASVIMIYKDGQIATLSWSLLAQHENTTMVYGTKGKIILNHTSAPDKGKFIQYKKNRNDPEEKEIVVEFESLHSNGFENEIQEATNRILNGELESPSIRWEDTVQILEICDKVRAQWNFRYPGE